MDTSVRKERDFIQIAILRLAHLSTVKYAISVLVSYNTIINDRRCVRIEHLPTF